MERRDIVVRGIVQGVGFRPFVHRLASRFGLRGFVRNHAGSVHIEVEGDAAALDGFLAALSSEPPPLAQVADVSWRPTAPRGDVGFHIDASDADADEPVFIAPDMAPCEACLAEMHDPAGRRFGYPFVNCTACGPRLTIVTGAPYDRPRTTMAAFAMCAACRREYDDPADRRFHAQPIACPACGPQLQMPLATFAATLQAGGIGAVKGVGGYHLACLAADDRAVAELRRRKHRDEKPFAVMVLDLAAAESLCEVGPAERELLQSPRRPIVLLRRHGPDVAAGVAPGNPYLGIMLPYSLLHHLLLAAVGGPLVMTSGNRADEPIAYQDDDAAARLAGIADVFLMHDRPIHVRCDDSVTRVVDGVELPVRRSRGYAPRPLPLPGGCPRPTLAVGGQLKATFALGRGSHAILSHHLGDLDDFAAYQAFERDVDLYEELFAVRPEVLAHDLHPDYASTGYARRRAAADGCRLVGVQHHHAHLASCLADNGVSGPAIGVIFDGAGFGLDGAVWGGEFLVGDARQVRRAAHFRYVGLPGGDQAAREPWRMAVAHLADAGVECPAFTGRLALDRLRTVRQMLERRVQTPPTSSVGRLFDAVAALAGVRDHVSYEGQAAVELEWLATEAADGGTYPLPLDGTTVDTRPLIAAVAADVNRGVAAAVIARRFHTALAEAVVRVCGKVRDETGLAAVALSGGVFLNALLTTDVTARLRAAGFQVYRQRQVPPNDGGLSLGQLAVVAAQCGPVS